MRVPYTRVDLDSPSPMHGGAKTIWEPMIVVRIGLPKRTPSPRFRAYVDSGSPFCIFKAELGELIGINVEQGEKDMIGGIISGVREPIYFHKVNLFVAADYVFQVRAGFMKKLHTHGLLGRCDFFDYFHVSFDHSSSPPFVEVKKIDKVQ